MMTDENYRPKNITFDVAPDESPMPEVLGEFKKYDEVTAYLSKSKLTTINQSITVSRHMDAVEKRELRDQYNDELENVLPRLERDHSAKTATLNDAKRAEKDAAEMVSASVSQVKILAREVKRGLKSINLDDVHTFRIPYRGRYYFYTWIDGVVRLCRISDIPEHEQSEIWNAQATNEEFIDKTFMDGEIEPEAGT